MAPIKAESVPDYRLFKRSLIAAVAALIVLMMLFSVWKSAAEYRLTIRGGELQSRGYASALKEHAERALGEADIALRDIVEQVQERGDINATTSAHLKKFLSDHSRSTPQIASIALVDRNGLFSAHSLTAPVTQATVADRDYFIHHRDNPADATPFLSKPFKSRLNGKWRIALSRPLLTRNGDFAGLAAVVLELDYFRTFYSTLDLGTNGKIVMVRTDGELLLAEPYKESDFATDFKKSHLIRTYLPRAPKGTYHLAGGKALLESNSRIISYHSLERFPVVALANLDRDEMLASWKKNAAIQAFLIIVVSIALWLLSSVLLRQIRRIEDAYQTQLEQQAQIAASSEAWQSTFDAAGDAIWVMDLERNVLKSNKATEKIFSMTGEQAIGHLCFEVAHSDHEHINGCPFQQMLETKQRGAMQISIGDRWYEVTVDPIKNSSGVVTGAVHIVSDITVIKQAEERALESEARMRALLSAIPDAIFFKDEAGKWLLVNEAGIRLFLLQQVDFLGKTDLELAELIPQRREALLKCRQSDRLVWEQRATCRADEVIVEDDGQRHILDTTKIPLFKTDGGGNGLVILMRDITDQKQMEMQLRQAQKMEAIGHLAGGIAHDFNNLLTPILGYAEMVSARLSPGDPLSSKVAGISAAAHKAKELTQQLLSFGRRQPMATTVIDLNEVIESFHIVLRRTIRESISISLTLDPAGAYVNADRSQMEQIILNMAVNAQDALSGKGVIAIETCKVFMEGENVHLHPGMTEGDYILLAFRDTGCGISSDILAHIFEPFFTTKPVGHGTGLGLATIYGIVKQHNGHISVSSRVNEGTTFLIYLPAAAAMPLRDAQHPVVVTGNDHAGKTVLVVEDNDMVREMMEEMLQGHGYMVLAASHPRQALEIAAGNRSNISLMVSDVVMPDMSGPELYEQLVAQMPSLRVVFISGYPMNPTIRGGTLEEEVSYLQKPFTAEALLERIRQAL